MNVSYLGNQERKQALYDELFRMLNTLKKTAGVEKVILFGSLADGEIGIKSDLDLVVIQKTEKNFSSRSIEIFQLLEPNVATDVIVYTPDEFTELQKNPNSFIRNILKTGKVIYEKQLLE